MITNVFLLFFDGGLREAFCWFVDVGGWVLGG